METGSRKRFFETSDRLSPPDSSAARADQSWPLSWCLPGIKVSRNSSRNILRRRIFDPKLR